MKRDDTPEMRLVTVQFLNELYEEIRFRREEKAAINAFLLALGYDWDSFRDQRFDQLPEMSRPRNRFHRLLRQAA